MKLLYTLSTYRYQLINIHMEEAIIEVLKSNGSLDTLQISKLVIGPKGTQKDVNPTLYKMLKEEKIKNTLQEGSLRPVWSIVI